MSTSRPIHLAGSLSLSSEAECFRKIASIAGPGVKRLPDGETGARAAWIGWQAATLINNPHLAFESESETDANADDFGAALGGAGWTMAHSTFNTTVQLSAAPWVTARSLALYQTATFAGMASGSVLFGWVAEHEGVATAFLAAAGAQAGAGILGFVGDLASKMRLHWRKRFLSQDHCCRRR